MIFIFIIFILSLIIANFVFFILPGNTILKEQNKNNHSINKNTFYSTDSVE